MNISLLLLVFGISQIGMSVYNGITILTNNNLNNIVEYYIIIRIWLVRHGRGGGYADKNLCFTIYFRYCAYMFNISIAIQIKSNKNNKKINNLINSIKKK